MNSRVMTIMGALAPITQGILEDEKNRDDRKERIKADWQKTKTMPRKMKKQRRKELKVDWSIAAESIDIDTACDSTNSFATPLVTCTCGN